MTRDRMLKLDEVAKRFSVGRGAIYRWIDSGNVFDSTKIKYNPGGHMRILESEVIRVINNSPSIED
jgi:predicted DNA-binding transcriptional regulator AlpA